MRNHPIFLVLAITLVLGACGGSPGSSPDSPSASAEASTHAAPSESAQATPIPIVTHPNECSDGAPCWCSGDEPCQFEGETYATFGRWAFLPGLTMTIPAGWYSTAQEAAEFNVLHPDQGDSGLLFWRDMIPVALDGSPITSVPSTPQGLTDWFTTNPNLIVSEPESVTIGHGIEATTFTFTTAPDAPNQDPTCPDYPPGANVCFGIFTMGSGFVTDVMGDATSFLATRLYLASIGPSSSPHLLVVAVVGSTLPPSTQTDPFVELERFEAAVQPILDSLDVSDVTFNCDPCN